MAPMSARRHLVSLLCVGYNVSILALGLLCFTGNALPAGYRSPAGPLLYVILGLTMPICPNAVQNISKLFLMGAVALTFFALPAHAQTYLSGTYDCTKIEVAGKIKPCSAPSLELNSDGSYQILSERGTYEIVADKWLVLSTSKNHGRARLEGKRIIFEFISGGKKSKITYRRKYQRSPGWVSS